MIPSTLMLPPAGLTFGMMFLCTFGHCGQTTQSLSHLTHPPSKNCFLCPRGQLQTSAELKGVDFRAGVSVWQALSPWRCKTVVFQQLPLYVMPVP